MSKHAEKDQRKDCVRINLKCPHCNKFFVLEVVIKK